MDFQPFSERKISFHGVQEIGRWRLKTYSVLHEAGLTIEAFDGAMNLTSASLPEPDEAAGRPGLGIFIGHHGTTGDYGILGWWNHENELALNVVIRRTAQDEWRVARVGESICVWDLEIIWEERQAWVNTMLSGRGDRSTEYLRSVPERFNGDEAPSGEIP